MPQVSIWTMNRREAGLLTGGSTAAEIWRWMQPRLQSDALLVLRDGGAGAFLFRCDNPAAALIPSPHVTMIDSTGAGDTHTGVLIAALARGLDPLDAMRRANAAAALSVTRRGPATAPHGPELDSFLSAPVRASSDA